LADVIILVSNFDLESVVCSSCVGLDTCCENNQPEEEEATSRLRSRAGREGEREKEGGREGGREGEREREGR
jgi:hypothetical protein